MAIWITATRDSFTTHKVTLQPRLLFTIWGKKHTCKQRPLLHTNPTHQKLTIGLLSTTARIGELTPNLSLWATYPPKWATKIFGVSSEEIHISTNSSPRLAETKTTIDLLFYSWNLSTTSIPLSRHLLTPLFLVENWGSLRLTKGLLYIVYDISLQVQTRLKWTGTNHNTEHMLHIFRLRLHYFWYRIWTLQTPYSVA